MCQIMKKLQDVNSKPVSKSFDNVDEIPNAIAKVSQILIKNNSAVISPQNRQLIIETIESVAKRSNSQRIYS